MKNKCSTDGNGTCTCHSNCNCDCDCNCNCNCNCNFSVKRSSNRDSHWVPAFAGTTVCRYEGRSVL